MASCLEKKRAADRDYYRRHAASRMAYQQAYRARNLERIRAAKRRRYLATREKVVARSRARYEAKREQILARSRQRYASDPAVRARYQAQARAWLASLYADQERKAQWLIETAAAERQRRAALSNGYVRSMLARRGWPLNEMSPELVETMRALVTLKREIRHAK